MKAIGLVRMLAINATNDFIPFTSVSASILASEWDSENDPTEAYVGKHNSQAQVYAEPAPRDIFGSILQIYHVRWSHSCGGDWGHAAHWGKQVAADQDIIGVLQRCTYKAAGLQSDGHTESHTAFVRALDIAGHPCSGID
jgi:hypothetical protein